MEDGRNIKDKLKEALLLILTSVSLCACFGKSGNTEEYPVDSGTIDNGIEDDDFNFVKLFGSEESFVATPDGFLYSLSEDKKARLITELGDGSMVTGISCIQFKRENGEFVLKNVAYPRQAEEGGVVFPSLFKEIHKVADGYKLYGTFSFGSDEDEVYKDTMFISNDFLNSDFSDYYDYLQTVQ